MGSERNATLANPMEPGLKAAPEFIAVGDAATAFLAGSVKGGG